MMCPGKVSVTYSMGNLNFFAVSLYDDVIRCHFMMSLGVGVQCDVIVKQEVTLSHTHPSTASSCGGSATSPIIIDSHSPLPTCLTPSPISLSP